MILTNLNVKNFRNIENLELDLNKNINIFIGNNAQGKTSILESIYVLALTKASKNLDDIDLIKKNDQYKLDCLHSNKNRRIVQLRTKQYKQTYYSL